MKCFPTEQSYQEGRAAGLGVPGKSEATTKKNRHPADLILN